MGSSEIICTMAAPRITGRMYVCTVVMSSGGSSRTSAPPNTPTMTSRQTRWVVAAPQIASTAASWPRRVVPFAPMVDCAAIAEGMSLFELLPMRNAWYMLAAPRIGK